MQKPLASTLGVGIDFGTSNSVAALFDGEELKIMKFGATASSIPSANYLDRSFLAVTGQAALDNYIADNVGRRIELAAIPLGEARTSTGSYDEYGLPQTANSQVMFSAALHDINLPGRLFYGSKQLLSSEQASVVPVFEKQYRLEAIITPIILHMKRALLTSCGQTELNHAVIGRPVNFEKGGQQGNERAVARLQTAFNNAGFTNQQFCFEPVAAAVNYLHTRNQDNVNTLLTVDFGGGTLDFSIFKKAASGYNVIGTHGIALGGNHIDQLLFRSLLFPMLGEGAVGKMSSSEGPIAARFGFGAYADLLLNWPVAYLLNQNSYLTPVQDLIKNGGELAVVFQKLLDLIQFNYSYLVFQHIKQFKEKFATQEQAELDIPELDLSLKLSRADFNQVLKPAIAKFSQALDEAIVAAGVREQDIDRVICVGGSTRLPAVREVLQQRFGDRVSEHDIFTSVAAGLAIQDFQRRQ